MAELSGRYAGKTVLITQADDAMGASLARRYAGEGANLVLAGEREEADSENILHVKADLSSYDGARALVKRALERFGALDAAVVRADALRRCSIEDASPEFIKEQMDENCRPYFTLTRALGEYMTGRGAGHVVYLSSVHGDKPTGCAFAYAMAKGALNMLCREAGLWFGRAGCTVNLIQAGALEGDGELFASELTGYHYRQDIKVPRHREGTPDELAPVCAFLTSGDASFVNGSILKADGGRILTYFRLQ